MERINRLFAAFLLLAYVSTGTSCFSMAALILAELEGSHLVFVTQTAQGTRVQLHHRDGDFTPEVADHDCALARWLVKLSKTAEEGDHVLSCAHLTGGQCAAEDDCKREVKEPLEREILVKCSAFKILGLKAPSPNRLIGSRCLPHRHRTLPTVRMLI